MRRKHLLPTIFWSLLFALLHVVSAHAQATRTWVSGVGDDVNPCSRTAPCKTFAGAISKTAAGGYINCIDPGGFGAVTITKSMTIDCTNTAAGILAAGTNGINVNGAGIVVVLRGLSLEGAGTGLIGINFIAGSALHVQKCNITHFNSGSAFGIQFAPAASASLFVSDTYVTHNGVGATGAGIHIRPTGAASVVAAINRVSAENNSFGVVAESTGTSGPVSVSIRDSVATGSPNNGIVFNSAGGAALKGSLDNVGALGNNTGIVANGGATLLVVHKSTVSQNMTGLARFGGAQIVSFSSNMFSGNITTDGTASTTQGSQDAR